MSPDLVAIILAIIASLPGVYALFTQFRKDAREDKTAEIDNADKVTKGALLLIDPLTARVTLLEKQIGNQVEEIIRLNGVILSQTKTIDEQSERVNILTVETRRQTNQIETLNSTVARQTVEIKDLNSGIIELVGQVVSLGQMPAWSPSRSAKKG